MKRRLIILLGFVLASISAPFFAFALTVSPARLEISGDPGQTITGEIALFDESAGESSQKNYYVSFENFEPRGDSGAPYFIGAKDGLATWLRSTDSVLVSSSEEVKVPFSITIPSSAKPGGYFAAVFFGTQPPTGSGGQVSVGGKVGVLILLRVNGEIEEGGGLVSFATKNNLRVVSTPPIIVEYRLSNTGGDRVVPRGTVSLLNTFRFKTEEVNANKNEGSVLPGSARRYEVYLGDERQLDDTGNPVKLGFFESVKVQLKDFKFGWYTAKLDITWGESAQNAKDSYHFFVIPWQALSILLLGFFLFGKGFKMILKRYNAWVLSQAGIYNQQNSSQKTIEKKENRQAKPSTASLHSIKDISKQTTQKPLQKPKRRI